MQFLHPEHDSQLELSTTDVFLVPAYFDGVSRQEVDLSPQDIAGGSQPIVTANMNAVTGKRMAETMARYGGLGVLPQDMDLKTIERIVAHLKNAPVTYDTALFVNPDATVRELLGFIRKRAHGIAVVVDENHHAIGVVTLNDLRGHDQYSRVGQHMSRNPVTLPENLTHEQAFSVLEESRLKAAPVTDASGVLKGVLTRNDAIRLSMQAPSLDSRGRLQVAAALGISSDAPNTAKQLVDLGVDVLVFDTAHGHQRRMLEALRNAREVVGPEVTFVAGNVCTAAGTESLIEAGADVVKVNVGPGAMCTTRMQTGAGRPTFSSVLECAVAARAMGKHVWADGGARHPRDVALYLAAGAARVMIGTMFAGTFESPGDIKEDLDGLLFKENYGMASARAVLGRTQTNDGFQRAKQALFKEGISTSKIYLRQNAGGAGDILFNILTGIRSSLTYAGALSLDDFHDRSVVGVQTAGGFTEGTPHGQVRKN